MRVLICVSSLAVAYLALSRFAMGKPWQGAALSFAAGCAFVFAL